MKWPNYIICEKYLRVTIYDTKWKENNIRYDKNGHRPWFPCAFNTVHLSFSNKITSSYVFITGMQIYLVNLNNSKSSNIHSKFMYPGQTLNLDTIPFDFKLNPNYISSQIN